ncbi:response regulator [bacterium]|nr:response regulator [bacterium]
MKNKKILIVDDDPNICEILLDILIEEGYQVVTACNGMDALERIRHGSFNLVITDVKMPIMDGMALLREIERSHKDIEVILITSYGNQGQQVEATLLGAYEYLNKPLNMDQLKEIIARALEMQDSK